MSTPQENIRDRLTKIKRLAESGMPGERENASRMLDALLKKYRLTEADLFSDERIDILLAYESELEKLLITQVVGFVTGENRIPYSRVKKGKKLFIEVEATAIQAAEIQLLCDHYLAAYRESAREHLSAFIQANSIFPESCRVDASQLSKDEIKEMLRRIKMAEAITPSPAPRKRLGKE